MSKGFLITFGIGLAFIAAVVGIVLFSHRGQHLEPKGSILKARTQELDKQNSLLVLEIRLVNDSDVPIIVRSIDVSLETPNGQSEGAMVAGSDVKSLFQYYPLLGEQYNEPLTVRQRIAPHQTADRMLAARFDVPLADLENRNKVTVKVEDVDGAVALISGK